MAHFAEDIFSYDQQDVSYIARFVKGSLITYFPITYNQQYVSDTVVHFAEESLITSFPIMNRK